MKKDMTQGREWKLILMFSLPIMAGNLLQQIYNAADNIILGNFAGSDLAFSAVAVCAPLTFFFLSLSIGLGVGSSVVISQLFGARQEKKLGIAVDTALILVTGIGLAVMGLGLYFAPTLLRSVLAVPDSIMPMATTYLRIYCIGLPFQFAYNCIASSLRGIGDSKASLYFLLTASILNIVLDLIAVINLKMGVAGAAWATVISQLVCVVLSYFYMRRKFPYIKGESHFSGDICKTILRIGLPTALQQGVVSIGGLLMQRLVNNFDEATIAAFGAGNRIDSFLFVPIMGFQAGLASFVGQNIGAGKEARVHKGYRVTVAMSLAATVFVSVMLYVFAPLAITFFGLSDPLSIERGVEQIRFLTKFFWVFSLYITMGGVLQGAGDTVFQSLGSLSALIMRVAIGYLGVHFGWFGYEAAWVTSPMGWGLASVITYARYFTGGWKLKAIARREEPEELPIPGGGA